MTTPTQFTGSNAEVRYKPEKENGALVFQKGANETTITEAINPAAKSIKVAAIAGLIKGKTVAVGKSENQEFLKVLTAPTEANGKVLTFDPKTLPNFRHAAGEAVALVESIGDFFGLGGVTSITPRSNRPLENSAAFAGGVRGVSNTIAGRYEFGADLSVELDIETMPLWFLYALNDSYESAGTPVNPAVTTALSAAAAKGAASIDVKGEEDHMAVGDFLEVGGKEVVKISKITVKKIEFAKTHPHGLRFAHANNAAVKKVIAPFTHTIKKGSNIPVGLSLLLKLSEGDDQKSLILLTGCRVGSLSLTFSGSSTISSATLNLSAAKGQVLSEDLFGDATKVGHVLYAQWEGSVSAGDANNRFNSVTIDINNNISSGEPFGTPLPGTPITGDGPITGSFEYEYRTQDFSFATAAGRERALLFEFTSISNPGHSLQIKFPKVKFGGAAHPAVTSKDRIPDTKEFTAVIDPATNTDIEVIAKTKNPSVEYLTEG